MTERTGRGGDPVVMLVSAALFGFFGFVVQWSTIGINGQTLPFMVLFIWTMRITALWFLVSALLVFARRREGYLLYAVGGLGSAIALVVIAVMDFMDGAHTIFAYAEFLLPIFALWNGWSSWGSLRELMGKGAGG